MFDCIRTRIIYYSADGQQHTHSIDAYIKRERFKNADKIDWNGVNGVCAEVDNPENPSTLTIFQAGGWTEDRGLFCDMY